MVKIDYRIGIFGLRRGESYARSLKSMDGIKIAAVCDALPAALERARQYCPPETKYFDDFDAFIDSGLDAVVLSNFFHEHSKYAVIALNKGIHVLSETTAAPTLGECVGLCEAVERTGLKYMLATNVPFMNGCWELARLYGGGDFGRVYYAEAEYMHPATPSESAALAPTPYHWRNWLPRTYYNMHTLGPLMFITKTIPRKVNARAIYAPELNASGSFGKKDAAAIMLYEMDNNAVFRTTGVVSLGPAGKWFRLNCANGTIETARGNQDAIKYDYTPWLAPKDAPLSASYNAEPLIMSEEARKSGHGGSDFALCLKFVQYLRGEEEPYFDVYNSVALSAAGILAWKSVLADGACYEIPDFRDKAARSALKDDFHTPFPDQNGMGATLPPSSRT